MEDQGSPTRTGDLAATISAARSHARDLLGSQRQRFDAMEATLSEQIETIAAELARDREELQSKQNEHSEQATDLERTRNELAAEREAWEQEQQQRAELVEQQRAELQAERGDFATEREAFAAEQDAVEQQKNATNEQRRRLAHKLNERRQIFEREWAERRAELDAAAQDESQQLAAMRQELDDARNKLAAAEGEVASGKERLAAVQQEFDNAKSEADQNAKQLAEVNSELEECRNQLAAAEGEIASGKVECTAAHDELASLREELDGARQRLADVENQAADGEALAAENADLQRKFDLAIEDVQELRGRIAELEAELTERPPGDKQQVELAELRAERDALVDRLEEAESQLADSEGDEELKSRMSDLQRRFEMAVEDLRDYKNRCGDLEEELKTAQAAVPRGDAAGDPMDWESQKRKMLASLEEDFDDGNPEERKARLSIEGTVQITDEVIASKDREIETLQQLLQQQSSNLEGVAIGAAAVADALDKDELVREERRRLAKLQAEWEEKLRKAEVELSVGRAKLARERATLDEKARDLEVRLAELGDGGTEATDDGKPRRRWLARLGIKEDE